MDSHGDWVLTILKSSLFPICDPQDISPCLGPRCTSLSPPLLDPIPSSEAWQLQPLTLYRDCTAREVKTGRTRKIDQSKLLKKKIRAEASEPVDAWQLREVSRPLQSLSRMSLECETCPLGSLSSLPTLNGVTGLGNWDWSSLGPALQQPHLAPHPALSRSWPGISPET